MIKRVLAGVVIVLVAVTLIIWGPTNPAGADVKPMPWRKVTVIKKRPMLAGVWVSSQSGLGTAAGMYATAFWNPQTGVTDFVGQLTPDGYGWADTPCPTGTPRPACLRVVWGEMPEGVYGKYEAILCGGGCLRNGVITVNRWGPYFCRLHADCPYDPTYGNENPWNRGTIVTHYFGVYMGLAMHPTRDCASVMSVSAWTCTPPRPGTVWLTAAETTYAAAW